ncbi:MAG: flavodoxin family protein [Spirochaetia bacterium]|jgi:flavodoxin
MSVKSLVIVYSYHHGNTARIARAMADALGAEVKTLGDVRPEELRGYELVGFGSGIDSSRHYKPLLDLADALPHAAGRRAFIFSTCGIPASIFGKRYIENYAEESHAALRKKLMSKGYTVAGEFNCAGFNTNSFLKYFGGVNKGRPDAGDLEHAAAFARNLKARAGNNPGKQSSPPG